MPAAYSQDLRDRVFAACDRGMATTQIATLFAVSPAWVRRLTQRRREAGEVAPRQSGSPGVPRFDRAVLAGLVAEQPDATGPELRARLAARTGVEVSDSAIDAALGKLGLSYKKRRSTRPNGIVPTLPIVARRGRMTSRARRASADFHRRNPLKDGAKTNMTRLRGRAPRGERLIDKTPHGHWKTTTLIAALGLDGMRCSTVVDGAVNGDVFEAFVDRVLVPELRAGDVIIMDNLSSHKRERTRDLIESTGAVLVFPPPYSPDLNPIELIFSKVKNLLRGRACRTRDELWRAMQAVLDQVTPRDARNCFQHCGYTLEVG